MLLPALAATVAVSGGFGDEQAFREVASSVD